MYFINTIAKVVIPAKRASHCIGPPRQILHGRKYSFTQRRTSEEVQHPDDQLGFGYLGLVVWGNSYIRNHTLNTLNHCYIQ